MIEAFARAARYAVWLQLCKLSDRSLGLGARYGEAFDSPCDSAGAMLQRSILQPATSRSKGVRESGAAGKGRVASQPMHRERALYPGFTRC